MEAFLVKYTARVSKNLAMGEFQCRCHAIEHLRWMEGAVGGWLAAAPQRRPSGRTPAWTHCGEGRCVTPWSEVLRTPLCLPGEYSHGFDFLPLVDSLRGSFILFFLFREKSREMFEEHPGFTVAAYCGLWNPYCYLTTLSQRKDK